MAIADLIKICHRCPHRQRPCAGPCACTIDGRDIIDHASAGTCPEGRYDPAAQAQAAIARQQIQQQHGCKGCGDPGIDGI